MLYSHQLDKIYLLLLVTIVIFISGCVRQAGVQANNGLSIIEFSPDLDVIGSNTPVTISLIVENIGERGANFVRGELIGLDDWTGDAETREKRSKILEKLTAADLVGNLPGGQDSAEWKVVSPSKQFNQKYDFFVKLSYLYQTHSLILLKAIGTDYFKSLPKEEQAKIQQGIVSISTTKGPLEVSAKAQQTFLTQGTRLPIEIEIKNVGTGRAFLGETPEESNQECTVGLDCVVVIVKGVSCSKDNVNVVNVKLTSGKTGRLVCYLDTSTVTLLQTFSIDVTINYNYFIEKTSSITVLKSIVA